MKNTFFKIIAKLINIPSYFISIKNIHTFILDYFGFKKGELTYFFRNNLQFLSRCGTSDAIELIIVNKDTEYPKRNFPKNEKPVIIDLGANIGAFSIYCCKVLENQNPVIFSIEPGNGNFKQLIRNIKLNYFEKNIQAFNLAISSKDGEGFLNIEKENDSFFIDLVDRNTSREGKYQLCKIERFETFCKKNKIEIIDLLKVDIEGSEYDVFETSIGFIQNNVRSIYIEIHNISEEKNIDYLINFLNINGFDIKEKIHENLIYLENRRH